MGKRVWYELEKGEEPKEERKSGRRKHTVRQIMLRRWYYTVHSRPMLYMNAITTLIGSEQNANLTRIPVNRYTASATAAKKLTGKIDMPTPQLLDTAFATQRYKSG